MVSHIVRCVVSHVIVVSHIVRYVVSHVMVSHKSCHGKSL